MHLLVFVYASIQNVKMNRIHFNTFEWKGGGGGGGGRGIRGGEGGWGTYIQGAYRRMYFFFTGRWAYDWGGGGYK